MPTTRLRSPRSIKDSEVISRAEEDELERARARLGRTSSGRSARGVLRAAKPLSGTSPGSGDGLTAGVTFLVGAAICSFLFFQNPSLRPFEAYRLVNCAALLWVPCMAILLFLKQDLKDFGLARGDKKTGLQLTLVAAVLMLPVLIYASLQPNFRQYYGNSLGQPLAIVGYAVRDGWTPPVRGLGVGYYEAGQGFYFFCWEFFFRGFLLFGLARARYIGNVGAILLQAIPFALLHWSLVPGASKPPLEIASALVGGLILGWLALRTKSFFYGFLIHWMIAAGLDLLIVAAMLIHPR